MCVYVTAKVRWSKDSLGSFLLQGGVLGSELRLSDLMASTFSGQAILVSPGLFLIKPKRLHIATGLDWEWKPSSG